MDGRCQNAHPHPFSGTAINPNQLRQQRGLVGFVEIWKGVAPFLRVLEVLSVFDQPTPTPLLSPQFVRSISCTLLTVVDISGLPCLAPFT